MLKRYRTLLLIGALLLVALILLLRSCGSNAAEAEASLQTSPSPELAPGIEQIRLLEDADPAEIDEILKDYHHQELLERRDDRFSAMDEDPEKVWSMLEDYVILGDSRGAGFKFISALDESRNLATYGNTIDHISENFETIDALNPSYIILVFGTDDILLPQCADEAGFKEYFTPYLQELQERYPDALILLNPIFPCIGEGLERYEQWQYTAKYDQVLREIASETGVCYVNCDEVELTDADYKEDGIHFWNDFMNRWMRRIVTTIYDAEFGLYEEPVEAPVAPSGTAEQASAV